METSSRKSFSSNRTSIEYDPRQPVTAAWSLEYLPVNVAVVFGQSNNIIGSRSWMFDTFVDALAEIQHSFPWSVGTHVLMWKQHNRDVYSNFNDAGIYPRIALEPDDGPKSQITAAFLDSCRIDMEKRDFEAEENNLLLVEALNSYAARETNLNTWSMSGVTEHHYLTRAFETYAVWQYQNRRASDGNSWGRPPNYAVIDRGVI